MLARVNGRYKLECPNAPKPFYKDVISPSLNYLKRERPDFATLLAKVEERMEDDVDGSDKPAVKGRRAPSSYKRQHSADGAPPLSPLPASKGGPPPLSPLPASKGGNAFFGDEYAAPPPATIPTSNESLYMTDSDGDESDVDGDAPAAPDRKIYDTSQPSVDDTDNSSGGTINTLSLKLDPSIEGESNTDGTCVGMPALHEAVENDLVPSDEESYMLPIVSPDYESPNAEEIAANAVTLGGDPDAAEAENEEEEAYMLPTVSPDYESPDAAAKEANAVTLGGDAAAAAAAAAAGNDGYITAENPRLNPEVVRLSLVDTARVLFHLSAPGKGTFLVAASVRNLLGKSGLSKTVLKGIWKKAKDPAAKASGMNETEFINAYQLVVDAGGVFEDSQSTTMPPAAATEVVYDHAAEEIAITTASTSAEAPVASAATTTAVDEDNHYDMLAPGEKAPASTPASTSTGAPVVAPAPTTVVDEENQYDMLAPGEKAPASTTASTSADAPVAAPAPSSPEEIALALFNTITSADGSNVVSAGAVSGLLATCGLESKILADIWNKAKVGSQIPPGSMNETEFVKAYHFAVEAGGTFAAPVTSTTADADAARLLFKSGNPGSKLDVVKASVASSLLSKSGLSQLQLKAIWSKAKADASAANVSVMNESEFVHAYQMAIEAGGNFEEKATPAPAITPPQPIAPPTAESSTVATLLTTPMAEETVAALPEIEAVGKKKKGRFATLGNMFGGGAKTATKKKRGFGGIKKRNMRAGSQQRMMTDDTEEDGSDAVMVNKLLVNRRGSKVDETKFGI